MGVLFPSSKRARVIVISTIKEAQLPRNFVGQVINIETEASLSFRGPQLNEFPGVGGGGPWPG